MMERNFVFLTVFSAKVKRSMCFRREKYIKVKDTCLNRMLWEAFWNISEKVRQAVKEESIVGLLNGTQYL